ncbi:MAG: serine hydrolase [candidate division WOR-3 bacterium]|jgi:CubicO group peptidase (beta-lactamase class C family)
MKFLKQFIFVSTIIFFLNFYPEDFTKKFEKIDLFVDSMLKVHNGVGLSIGIVYRDSLIYAKGYGYSDYENKKGVTVNTLFAIGSCTKSFTATALSILVQDGKMEFDKPLKDYLPDFQLYDEVSEKLATPLDILTHRIGLPRHDFMWYGSTFSREDIYKRLKYLKPNYSIRTKFQYQNHMYLVAGYLVEKVSGESWENFVNERILKPLKMEKTNFSTEVMKNQNDFAYPYYFDGKKIVKMNFREFPAMGPAGTINSNVIDMAKWLIFILNKGKGYDILSSDYIDNMITPKMIVSERSNYPERSFRTYGMGWFIEYYRGKYHIFHGGNIDGFSAHMGIFPDDSFGVVVLSNMNNSAIPFLVEMFVSELMLGLDPTPWSDRLKDVENLNVNKLKKEEIGNKKTKPSHPLKDYAGVYENKGYGKLKIEYENSKLILKFNELEMKLTHFHYDVFTAKSDGMIEMDTKISFETDKDGNITKLYFPIEPLTDDIVFEKVIEDDLFSISYLKKFEGKYILENDTLEILLTKDQFLTLNLKGQQSMKIVPKSKNYFEFKELKGFFVRFNEKNEKIINVDIIQPNGTFTFKKIK